MGKGKTGLVKGIEVTMKIAAILVFSVGLLCVLLNVNFSSLPLRIGGAVLSISGTAVFIAAVITMQDNWRAGVSQTNKTELVTSGIYQYSRNPAFLGFDLLYLGLLLMFFNWALCVVSIFAMVMYHLQIVKVEEAFLQAAFGEEYLKYKKEVCRYLGRKR
ncbi:methyltransferase family protein [Holdemania massiliensis]|uniref:methyltransferase family protein n=1 Tax=Holdemania massiliensis TaxID=1468449 RepID=UPI001FCC7562|nr:isoprenylcysteine carboxylmethyltransferase family protein [Holdemania massiliensis]